MRPSWMPSIGDIIFILILQLIFFYIPNSIFGDGSTGWHLVTGQYVLEQFSVPHQDLISYTFPDKAWVAYEWLFDTAIAALDKIAGLRLVAVACCGAIAWLFLLLYGDCRKRGCHFIPSMILCIGGALVSAIHWLVRPHLVTFFGVYIYSKYLHEFYEEKISAKKLISILALSMLVWVNSHPAFLMGIVLISIYIFSDLLIMAVSDNGLEREKCSSRVKTLALCFLLACSVTLLNPCGTELYKYIYDYLHQSAVLSQNDEFCSPSFHGDLQTVLLELLYFSLAVGLVCTQKKPSLPAFLTVLAFLHLSLASKRNMALFVIVSLPFIAELLARARFSLLTKNDELRPSKWFEKVLTVWKSSGETMNSMEFLCSRHALPIAAVILLAISCFNNGTALGLELVRSQFDPKNKPIATLICLQNNKLDPRHGLSFDNWGGYIKYKTGIPVFIDDRSDFYGEKFYLDYAEISTIQPEWRATMAKYKIDWVLFPNNSLLVSHLEKEPGWKLLCKDEAASLYVREAAAAGSSGNSSLKTD